MYKQDGADHINISPRGVTRIGNYLSNTAYTPFVIDMGDYIEGEVRYRFASIEALWYWLLTGDNRLPGLYGANVRKFGEELLDQHENSLQGRKVNTERFKTIIGDALWIKAETYKETCLKDLFVPNNVDGIDYSALPLDQYQTQGNVQDTTWMVEEWRAIQKHYKS